MKKYFLLVLSAVCAVMGINAQVASLDDGFYRVHNSHTDRYIYVLDNKGELMYQQATADMNAITLYKGLTRATSDPASVLYIEKHADKYDITAQSTGIFQMISTYLNIMHSRTLTGAYWAYGAKAGTVLYLYDAVANLNAEEGYLTTGGAEERRNWYITKIDNSTDNFFGVKPTVKVGSKWYQPFYADFPFDFASSGMKAYYVSKVDEENGLVVYKPVNGVVPRSTPVFIECSSDQPASNKLNLGGTGASISDNLLKGVYFDLHMYKHDNFVKYDKTTMRSLGLMSDGSLGVVTGNYTDVPRNTFYLPVSSKAPAQMKLVTEEEYDRLVVKEPVLPTAVTLSASTLTLTIGQSQTLTATVSPADTTDPTVTWTSSNTSVATVDAAGKVNALNVGTATITARCGNVSATCQVTVKPVEATSVTLSSTSVSVNAGETVTLTATVAPDNTTDKTVVWTSSNTAVATVVGGTITGVTPGTATITARCGNVSATCQVTVTAIPVTSVSLSQTQLDLFVGDTHTLTATVAPANATYRSVSWSSSNSNVVTVNQYGHLTAVSAGTATITAKSGDVQATCQVTVKNVEASSITLSASLVSLHVGETTTLTATVAPANTTFKTVEWSSSNTSVATVDANGKITAVALGEAVITAKCGAVTTTCRVNVTPVEAVSIELQPKALWLNIGETAKISATVLPVNTTDKTVVWTSSNESVVTVDQAGNVTALAVGYANVVATCGNVSAFSTVTVNPIEVTSITLNKTELTLNVGDKETLTATVAPDNATDKTVIWTSSNPRVAEVSQDGEVVALEAGETEIRATALSGNIYGACKVTVVTPYVPVEEIFLSEMILDLKIGETAHLTAMVYPFDATDQIVTWTSSDTTVADVDDDGYIKAKALGSCNIIASCGGVQSTCYVNVSAVLASEILLDKTEMTLEVDSVVNLVAKVLPANTTDPTVIWVSSNPLVADVTSSGEVTAYSEGTATIIAMCDGASAECQVTVIKRQEGISDILADGEAEYDIYNLQGIKVRSRGSDLRGLPRGFYIIGNQKVYVK